MTGPVTRRTAVATGAVIAAALAVETWLLVGRRSGEPAYQPPAAVIVRSLEAAGAEAISQTFVPGADGLAAVSFVPLLSGRRLRAGIDLQLDADGSDVPLARRRLRPEELVDGVPFWWDVPRVERAAARQFTLSIAVPEAAPGEGLQVAIGPPDYRWGELRVGVRRQWGDLVFATRATRVHVLDTLRTLRRPLAWPWRTDGALVLGLVLVNLAAVAVIGHLVGRSGPPAARAAPAAETEPSDRRP